MLDGPVCHVTSASTQFVTYNIQPLAYKKTGPDSQGVTERPGEFSN